MGIKPGLFFLLFFFLGAGKGHLVAKAIFLSCFFLTYAKQVCVRGGEKGGEGFLNISWPVCFFLLLLLPRDKIAVFFFLLPLSYKELDHR